MDKPPPARFWRMPGVAGWVRTFAVKWIEAGAPPPSSGSEGSVRWINCVISGSDRDHAMAQSFAVAEAADGLLIWVGTDADERVAHDIFVASQDARSLNVPHLAICHTNAPLAGFARSLALERQFRSVRIIERTTRTPHVAISRELAADVGDFCEVRLSGDGRRYVPQFALVSPPLQNGGLGRQDVVLVTGGTKGIGAECALRLALRTGAALAFVGRSAGTDVAVAATLGRASALGIRCSYAVADVTDEGAMLLAASHANREFGPITALLHAAGSNETKLFQDISIEEA